MSSPITQSAVAGILKELYDDQKIQWLTYKDNPLLAMLKKETVFPGKQLAGVKSGKIGEP